MDHVYRLPHGSLIRLTCSERTLLSGPTQHEDIIHAQNSILAELRTKQGDVLTNFDLGLYRERLHWALTSSKYASPLTLDSVERYEVQTGCLNHMLDKLRVVGTGFWKDMQRFRSPKQN